MFAGVAMLRTGASLLRAAGRLTPAVPVVSGRSSSTAALARTAQEASVQNRRARVELAALYRILATQDLHEGVCNHLTLMAPAASGDGDVMLLIPYGLHWSEVTASSLVGVNEQNEVVEGTGEAELSAACIHRGVRLRGQPNTNCVLHTHMPYATALSCLVDPTLKFIHQGSIRFHNRIAYDREYDGYALAMDEGHRLSRILGDNDVMIMCNHGVLACGETAALAYDRLYYLERAAMFQILAASSGKELSPIPEDRLIRWRADMYGEKGTEIEDHFSRPHMDALLRKLKRQSPDFLD